MFVCTCSVDQSCLTLRNPMDCSSLGSSVHGILQARTLEWPCPPPGESSRPRDRTHVYCASCMAGRFFTTETPRKPKTPIGNPILTSYKERSISEDFKRCHSVITTALSKKPVGRGLQYERLLTIPFAVTCESPADRNVPPSGSPTRMPCHSP